MIARAGLSPSEARRYALERAAAFLDPTNNEEAAICAVEGRQLASILRRIAKRSAALPAVAPAALDAETFVRDLLWNEHPECCGCPVVGAEYMGQQEQVCCGNPEFNTLNDRQIVATLRSTFRDSASTLAAGKE